MLTPIFSFLFFLIGIGGANYLYVWEIQKRNNSDFKIYITLNSPLVNMTNWVYKLSFNKTLVDMTNWVYKLPFNKTIPEDSVD